MHRTHELSKEDRSLTLTSCWVSMITAVSTVSTHHHLWSVDLSDPVTPRTRTVGFYPRSFISWWSIIVQQSAITTEEDVTHSWTVLSSRLKIEMFLRSYYAAVKIQPVIRLDSVKQTTVYCYWHGEWMSNEWEEDD